MSSVSTLSSASRFLESDVWSREACVVSFKVLSVSKVQAVIFWIVETPARRPSSFLVSSYSIHLEDE